MIGTGWEASPSSKSPDLALSQAKTCSVGVSSPDCLLTVPGHLSRSFQQCQVKETCLWQKLCDRTGWDGGCEITKTTNCSRHVITELVQKHITWSSLATISPSSGNKFLTSLEEPLVLNFGSIHLKGMDPTTSPELSLDELKQITHPTFWLHRLVQGWAYDSVRAKYFLGLRESIPFSLFSWATTKESLFFLDGIK